MTEMIEVPAQDVTPEEQPTFDFSDVSWGEAMDVSRALLRLYGGIKPGEEYTVLDAMTEIVTYLARTVRTVPRSWVSPRAPDVLDWSDVESFRHLRREKMRHMIAAMREAERAENLSGN